MVVIEANDEGQVDGLVPGSGRVPLVLRGDQAATLYPTPQPNHRLFIEHITMAGTW